MIVEAMCTLDCWQSAFAQRYVRGVKYQLDLTDPEQRKLVYMKYGSGKNEKWVFDFDRANSSDTDIKMFFCKECGQPFEALNDIGTHSREMHKNDKLFAEQTKAQSNAEANKAKLAEVRAKQKQILDEAISEQQHQVGA